MSPTVIAEYLKSRGVQLAALTDHNSALNCPAFAEACRVRGVAALYGMEAQTSEEVHALCLFSRLDTALSFSDELYDLMPPIWNIPEKTGDQVYVDAEENILGEVEKYLVTSVALSLDELAERVISLGGIIIPAHVDRPAFSLTSQLGFIPDGPWAALEVVRMPPLDHALRDSSYADTRGYPLTTSSDAHYIEHIARRSFELNIGDLPLFENDDITVCMETIKAALSKRPL
jgi:PHP family Zn ribbon phosphoesterase